MEDDLIKDKQGNDFKNSNVDKWRKEVNGSTSPKKKTRENRKSPPPNVGSSLKSSSSHTQSSSLKSTSKLRPTPQRHDCGSSKSDSHVGNHARKRQHKRMRTKSSTHLSPRKHHDREMKRPATNRDAEKKQHSPQKCEDKYWRQERHGKEREGRADQDSSWRKRSSHMNEDVSSTREPHDTSSQKVITDATGSADIQVKAKADRKNTGMKYVAQLLSELDAVHVAKNSQCLDVEKAVDRLGEDYDFASDIFRDVKLKVCNAVRARNSGSVTKSDPKKAKEKRVRQWLKLSEERRRKEYVGYEAPYVHKLYSFGMDNKGKKEPLRTSINKKAEDRIFRKREVYMTHLEEQRKRDNQDKRNRSDKISNGVTLGTCNNTSEDSHTPRNSTPIPHEQLVQETADMEYGDKEEMDVVTAQGSSSIGHTSSMSAGNSEAEGLVENSSEGDDPIEADAAINEQTKDQGQEQTCDGTIDNIPLEQKSIETEMAVDVNANNHKTCEASDGSTSINCAQSVEPGVTFPSLNTNRTCSSREENEGACCSIETNTSDASSEYTTSKEGGKHLGEVTNKARESLPAGPEIIPQAVTGDSQVKAQDGNNVGRHTGLPRVMVNSLPPESGKVVPANKHTNVIRIPREDSGSDTASNTCTCKIMKVESVVSSLSGAGGTTSNAKDKTIKGSSITAVKECGDLKSTHAKAPERPVIAIQAQSKVKALVKILPASPALKQPSSSVVITRTIPHLVTVPAPQPTSCKVQHQVPAPIMHVAGVPKHGGPTTQVLPIQTSAQSTIFVESTQLPMSTNTRMPIVNTQLGGISAAGPNLFLHRLPGSIIRHAAPVQLQQNGRSVTTYGLGSAPLTDPPCIAVPGNTLGLESQQPTSRAQISEMRGTTNTTSVVFQTQTPPMIRESCKTNHQELPQMPGEQTKAVRNPVPAASNTQALMGYVNVPIIKDDKGRMVVLLPNDQNILASLQLPRGNHAAASQANSPKCSAPVPSLPHKLPCPVSAENMKDVASPTNATTLKNVDRVPAKANNTMVHNMPEPSADLNMSQGSEPLKLPGYVQKRKDSVESILVGGTDNDDKKLASTHGKEEETCSEEVHELRTRQKAIIKKLKELRSVRVLIAKHGRMDEEECVNMVERLKQVENLFFRRLVISSAELLERQEMLPQDGMPLQDEILESMKTLPRHQVKAAAVSKDGSPARKCPTDLEKGKKSDVMMDQLLDTANLLKKCITAMAKKKHPKESPQSCVEASEKKKQPINPDKKSQEANRAFLAKKHTECASSLAENESDNFASIGSPLVHHFQSMATPEASDSDKIVLRLQRVRCKDNPEVTSRGAGGGTLLSSEPDDTSKCLEDSTSSKLTESKGISECQVDGASLDQINVVIRPKSSEQTVSSSPKNNTSSDGSREMVKDSLRVGRSEIDVTDTTSQSSESRIASDDTSSSAPTNKCGNSKNALFTGPTKEMVAAEEKREREIVKKAWNRAFPCSSVTTTRAEPAQVDSYSYQTQTVSFKEDNSKKVSKQAKPKQVKHVYGNPVIRRNLASIGNINVTKQVGGTNESRFQWLVRQLQKKRTGDVTPKPRSEMRSVSSTELSRGEFSAHEEPREYISLTSRGVQTEDDLENALDDVKKSKDLKAIGKSSQAAKRCSVAARNGESRSEGNDMRLKGNKKRDRDSTGSGGKPTEKQPRVVSPMSYTSDYTPECGWEPNDDMEDLISLREEVLSRASSSSDDTLVYNGNLISVEETTRVLKSSNTSKKRVKSAGTMTIRDNKKIASKSQKENECRKEDSSACHKSATKTRGHKKYGWGKKKTAPRFGKSSGKSKKKKKTERLKTQKSGSVVEVSDDYLSEDSVDAHAEKEKDEQKTNTTKQRNTIASLSARMWDECYWSTINDTTASTSKIKNVLPSNNSPPSTRPTGLESKMLEQWGDLLRYSGNCHDMDVLPTSVGELESMDLPAAVTKSMAILLEGYNMVRQNSSSSNENCRPDPGFEEILFEKDDSSETGKDGESGQAEWEPATTSNGEGHSSCNGSSPETGRRSLPSENESSRNTEFTFDTLTSRMSVDAAVSSRVSPSSSPTLSLPSLDAAPNYPTSDQASSTGLRRWQTQMELASGANGNGHTSPDYSADMMNQNNCHEEGDTGVQSATNEGGVGASWQIGGAGDLREPRVVTMANGTGRNRRRQNRVMSWPNIIEEQYDSEDEIPLARLIERDRLRRVQSEEYNVCHAPVFLSSRSDDNLRDEQVSHVRVGKEHRKLGKDDLGGHLTDVSSAPSTERVVVEIELSSGNSSDTDLPDPFILDYHSIINKSKRDCASGGRGSSCDIADGTSFSASQNEKADDLEGSSGRSAGKKTGKNLYGESKKGKSLVRKKNKGVSQ